MRDQVALDPKAALPALTRFQTTGASAAVSIIAGATLLLVPAVINGFPFALDDSAGYVSGERVVYHSIFYNLFVEGTDLGRSPWLVIAVQALIVTHVVWLWQRVLLGPGLPVLFVATMAGLSALTSLGLVAGYLMPDIFTPVAILAIGLLAFARVRLARTEIVYLVALAAIAVAVHLSHIPIAAGAVVTATVILLVRGDGARQALASAVVAASPVVLAAGALFASNALYFGLPKLSPAGPVFLVANLIGKGPARDYLREVCPAAAYKACGEADYLHEDSNYFLWAGPLDRLGGFEAFREEAATIAAETLRTRPVAVARAAAVAVRDALLTHRPGWEYRPLRGNTWWFERNLATRYGPDAAAAWQASLQANDAFPRTLLKSLDAVVLPVSLLGLLAGTLLAWRRGWADLLSFNALVLAGIAANVLVCAVGSGVFDRYQTRVTWLVPLAAVLVAMRMAQSLPAARALIPRPFTTSFPRSETA